MFPSRLKYFLFLLLLVSCSLSAQRRERRDSLVRLLGCDKLQQFEERGAAFRKAEGHVRFQHNGTLLICDTALWNVNANTIKAFGKVKIIQNRTVLSSDKLDYFIDENLAQFRGAVVQLQDKDKNTLRTRYLDYNTKDSVATFTKGGAFRDKDGQLIESIDGTYDSKIKNFSFRGEVNMYTDSVFIKTRSLDYNTGTSIAVFTTGTHAWREKNMLSENAGWYDHKTEVFTFTKDVHVMTENQEAWSDSLIYYRTPNNAEMFGNVELLDTGRELAAVAGYMQYIDSLQYIKMTRDPAVIAVTEDKEVRDTVYIGADVLTYWTVPRYLVSENEVTKAESRMKGLEVDPILEHRRKAAEEAKAAAEAARKKLAEEDPNAAAARNPGGPGRKNGPMLPATWEMEQEQDELFEWPQLPDSLNVARQDSLKRNPRGRPDDDQSGSIDDASPSEEDDTDVSDEPVDTTRMGFLVGLHNVKVFRKDMQVACDSLLYNDLDSLVRLYKNPIVWNEIRRQYSSDSIYVVIKDRKIDKASLMSDAFIIFQEDSVCFDQIKGTEMMAFFDSTGGLRRFDSMGGSSGVFFIEENGTLATVNKFEAKMLTASFKDGNLYDLNYFEEVKSDAYPLVQLKGTDRVLKGFEWQPDKRPKGPEDVTAYVPRESEREKYENIPRPLFKQTEDYFPGYIAELDKQLKEAEERKRLRRAERKRLEEERKELELLESEEQEDVVTMEEESAENGVTEDVTKVSEKAKETGLEEESDVPENHVVAEEAEVQADSLNTGNEDLMETLRAKLPVDEKAELKAKQRAEREAKKARNDEARREKLARKESKWAAKDAKDAEKAARKAAKAQEKQRIKMEKMLKAKAEREAKEQKILDRYKAKYEKKKSSQESRKSSKESRKSSQEDKKATKEITQKVAE